MGHRLISEAEFQQQLAALNAEFRLSLAEKIASIEDHWTLLTQAVNEGEGERACASGARRSASPARGPVGARSQVERELHRALHSLAGSAPVFGFPELGEAARRAELALGSFDKGCAELLPAIIQQAIKIMREHLEAHPTTESRHTQAVLSH